MEEVGARIGLVLGEVELELAASFGPLYCSGVQIRLCVQMGGFFYGAFGKHLFRTHLICYGEVDASVCVIFPLPLDCALFDDINVR